MPLARFQTFDDPEGFQASFRATDCEMLSQAKSFSARLSRMDFDRLWMQRADMAGPVVFHGRSAPMRFGVVFLADSRQAHPFDEGVELSSEEVLIYPAGEVGHFWSRAASRIAMMSLDEADAARASVLTTGLDLPPPRAVQVVRPDLPALERLRALHQKASRLAELEPAAFAKPAIVTSLERGLTGALMACVAPGNSTEAARSRASHSRVIARFEEFLEARRREPVYLPEICAAIGASERTLRSCCHERFGTGPIRYLWLRRMHLARSALLAADPALTTVTEIATGHGFWELGRFSTEYRKLFGEPPSLALRRAASAGRHQVDAPAIVPNPHSPHG